MKNKYHESHIMKSIDEVGFRETDKMVEENPKLKAENATQKQLIVTQKQLIDALKQLNESKDETIKAKDQTIEILMKRSTTEERYRNEESEFSKFCLNLQ
ncbi:hypothetical protein KVL55_06715 [Helicobacter pylori]|nr:hypothetical protein KVL55_06715 [Helicobacter pylori]